MHYCLSHRAPCRHRHSTELFVEAANGTIDTVNDLNLNWAGQPLLADLENARLFLSLNSDFNTTASLSGALTYQFSSSGYHVSVAGIRIDSGDTLSVDLRHGDTLGLDIMFNGELIDSFTVVVTNLPVVEIRAETIVDEPKNPDLFRLVDGPAGTDTGWLPLGIEIRGATARSLPKVPYGFELREDDGSELDLSLLGLRDNDGDWILDAAYRDQLFVRNLVSHDLYRMMRNFAYRDANGEQRGQSTIAGGVVELILNSSYNGVYVLSERVDRKLLDLELDQPNVPEDQTGERCDLVDFSNPQNGSLLINANQNRSDFYATQPIERVWEQRYPDPDDVNRLSELDELITFVNDSNNARFIAEISTRVDLQSLPDMFLLRTATSNTDTLYKNYYIARNQSMKWFFVPWDYDGSFGIRPDGSEREDSLRYFYPGQNLLVCRLIKTPDSGFNAIMKSVGTRCV